MAKYTISIVLTDAQDVAMQEIALKAEKTILQIFQQFWDGYTSEGIFMEGPVQAQVKQWIVDKVKEKLDTMDSAEALIKLA